jgi:lipopolysaccharide/colanic/teichoic acid biosynthesis glycosyltransferase
MPGVRKDYPFSTVCLDEQRLVCFMLGTNFSHRDEAFSAIQRLKRNPSENSVTENSNDRFLQDPVHEQESAWSNSRAKHLFDCMCVLFALPVMMPVFLMIALAVRLTSRGPVLFLQRRMGRHGRPFTILKFRTLTHLQRESRSAVTTAENQRFTPVGAFLRRWKLDELPQLLNVLVGDMSLVGARPKLPQHQVAELAYRPGITGAATLVFAREELALARVPNDLLESHYHTVILPAKHAIDSAYMAQATFLSDLKLIVITLSYRWGSSIVGEWVGTNAQEAQQTVLRSKAWTDTAVLDSSKSLGRMSI